MINQNPEQVKGREEWETMLEYALPDKLTEEEKTVIRNNVGVLISRAEQRIKDIGCGGRDCGGDEV